ncbi:MAG: 3-deoxy-8-phosphooctulonate synthase [Acidobacteriota bacterium]
MTVTPFELAPGIELGGDHLPIIGGPCVIEGTDWLVERGVELSAMADRVGARYIFKSSYDKANRSSLSSFRGPGLEQGLAALAAVKEATGRPLLTDVHAPSHCEAAAEIVDVLQIPAFLCRQTDLVVAAAQTGKPVLIKKGQFMAPDEMRRVVDKARQQGNDRVGVTERGSTFGYHNLVVDMRSFLMMQRDGIPVLYDVTHSLQLPGAREVDTGGDRRFAEPLARAAVVAGAGGLYLESHPDPDAALCDSATQLPPERAEALIQSALVLHRAVRSET